MRGDGPVFDVEALFTAVDRQRRTQRIRFRDVANQAGVSASLFTRLGYGHHPDVTSLVRLLAWLGTTDLGPFITREPGVPEGDGRGRG